MNQILYNVHNNKKNLDNEIKDKYFLFFKKRRQIYFFVFISLIFLIIIIFVYIIYNKYDLYIKNKYSKNLINTYNISSLYSSSNNYTAVQLSKNISIIGLIEIPNINISYPILSDSNDESLKISVCRFSRSNA